MHVCMTLAWPLYDLTWGHAAFYGWTTPGKIMKRPQTEDAPQTPARWVLLGHSLGVMGLELVSTRLWSLAFQCLVFGFWCRW